MATSKFRPFEVPDQVAPAVREYLDDTLNQMAVLLDGAADYLDDDLILRAANDETITGAWTFSGDIDVNGDLLGPVNINTAGTDWALQFNRIGVFTGGFYHDLTSQYWLNNLGQTVLQNPYGTKELTLGGDMTIPDNINLNFGTDDDHVIDFNAAGNYLSINSAVGSSIAFLENVATKFYIDHSNDLISVRDGYKLRIYNSTDTDYFELSHNGTDAVENYHNSSWLRRNNENSGVTGFLNQYSLQERWYDSDNSDSIRIRHDDTRGIIDLGNNSGQGSIGIYPNTSASAAGITTFYNGAVADDATVTFDLPSGIQGGFLFIVAGSSGNTSTAGHSLSVWASNSFHTKIYGDANYWTYGTSSNPDVDGDYNIWFTNSGRTVSIKNRRGNSQYFSVMVLGGP